MAGSSRARHARRSPVRRAPTRWCGCRTLNWARSRCRTLRLDCPRRPARSTGSAPELGAHDDEIFGAVLGLSEDERAVLRDAGVIYDTRMPMTRSMTSCGALAGEPESNGGWGSYSMPSCTAWATTGPCRRSSNVKAMSMPADTPAPVMILPRSTTAPSPLGAHRGPTARRRWPNGWWRRSRREGRRPQKDRAGAHGGGPGGGGVHPLQPRDDRVIGNVALDVGAAGHHDNVGRGDVGERPWYAVSVQRPYGP